MGALGSPHLHLRSTSSTNDRARELAARGAPHGTLVSADEQTAGRGRQGRTWSAPPGRALLMSVVLRDPLHELLPLVGGVAVARAIGPDAMLKWPNDVLLAGAPGEQPARKVAGILTEGRPQEGWAVLGIGLNVAVRPGELPAELRDTAATLGRRPSEIGPLRSSILRELEEALWCDSDVLLERWRERDALRGRPITWSGGSGVAAGIDGSGRLVVELTEGGRTELDAGEVHLGPV